MATAAEIRIQIAEIDAKLSEGVRSAGKGDANVSYDLVELGKQRDRLMRQLTAQTNSQFARVVFKNA